MVGRNPVITRYELPALAQSKGPLRIEADYINQPVEVVYSVSCTNESTRILFIVFILFRGFDAEEISRRSQEGNEGLSTGALRPPKPWDSRCVQFWTLRILCMCVLCKGKESPRTPDYQFVVEVTICPVACFRRHGGLADFCSPANS